MMEGQKEVGSRISIKKGLRNLVVGAGKIWVTLFEVVLAWLSHHFHISCLSSFKILVEILRAIKILRSLSTALPNRHSAQKINLLKELKG